MGGAYTPLEAFLNSFLAVALRAGRASPKWTQPASRLEPP